MAASSSFSSYRADAPSSESARLMLLRPPPALPQVDDCQAKRGFFGAPGQPATRCTPVGWSRDGQSYRGVPLDWQGEAATQRSTPRERRLNIFRGSRNRHSRDQLFSLPVIQHRSFSHQTTLHVPRCLFPASLGVRFSLICALTAEQLLPWRWKPKGVPGRHDFKVCFKKRCWPIR